MPWDIRSVVGERRRLVQALLRKEKSVQHWCRIFGISRKTAYKWKHRFLEGGRSALRNRSRRPKRMPRQLEGRWVGRLKRLRKQRPDWGPKKLQAHLQAGHRQAPSLSTIARLLKRLGLVNPKRRRPPIAGVKARPPLTVARRPNHVWTVDFKGWYQAGNGERCEPLTVRDLFSRYALEARLLATQHWRPVQPVFARLFRANGRPEVIRVDNGAPFASRGPAGLSRLSVWWMRLGIKVEFTRPACPQDNGSHEQFHRVMKRETVRPSAWSRRGQQHRTTLWLRDYNQERPHEALGQKTPARWYRKSRRRFPQNLPPLRYGATDQVRRVRSNGEIRWAGRKRFIGEAFVGQMIALRRFRRGSWSVYFSEMLIGHLHEQDLGAMRPVHYKHRHRVPQRKKVSPMS